MPKPGTDTGSVPGFLATTVQLCDGTEILTRIYKSSPGRAAWRFFLLTVLCSILAAVIGTLVLRGPFKRTGQALDEEIGAFEFTHQRISLTKDPDTPRHLRLSGAVLEYFPGDSFTREDFNADRTTAFGFTILSGGMASWWTDPVLNRNGEDVFVVLFMSASELYKEISPDQEAPLLQPELLSGAEFAKKLKAKFGSSPEDSEAAGNKEAVAENSDAAGNEEAVAENSDAAGNKEAVAENSDAAGNEESARSDVSAENEEKPAQPVVIKGSEIVRSALEMITAITFLKTLFRNFVAIGLIILLVSLIQYLRASTLPKGIAYRNVLTIMIYSTFPAQIAATLLDAAGLERFLSFLSFNILFVCIFFVYQIFAFRAVMKKVCPQNDRKDDDFGDSDF